MLFVADKLDNIYLEVHIVFSKVELIQTTHTASNIFSVSYVSGSEMGKYHVEMAIKRHLVDGSNHRMAIYLNVPKLATCVYGQSEHEENDEFQDDDEIEEAGLGKGTQIGGGDA